MNKVLICGMVLNEPRYDVVSSTSDAILRMLIRCETGGNNRKLLLPVICCNEMADAVRPKLESFTKKEIYISGRLAGCHYTDSVGGKRYFHYLIAEKLGKNEEELEKTRAIPFAPLRYTGLPFMAADLEDILRYM